MVAGGLSNVDASTWVRGLPAGLTVTANAAPGSNTITLTFGGVPVTAAIRQFIITIPGSAPAGGNDLAVDANPKAFFIISGIPQPPGWAAGIPQPPSDLPRTGDGFPRNALLALMGALLLSTGILGYRMRAGKQKS